MKAIIVLLLLAELVTGQDHTMQLTEANTRFALDTYNQLALQDGNVFFSPLSLSIVLGMLYEGARGNTRNEMEAVANFDMIKDLSSSFRELSSILNTPNKNYTLKAANRIYANSDYSFLPHYIQTLRDNYHSDVIASDFMKNAENVRAQINDWTEKQTMEKIKNLIPKNALETNTQMVLVNAMYFKGNWVNKFESKRTVSQKFFLGIAKQSVSVDMMTQKGKFKIVANRRKGYQALELPYQGKDLSMIVVLPNNVEGLAEVEKHLTFDEMGNVHRSLGSMPELDVVVSLPKFKIDQKYLMNDHASKMGLKSLFVPGTCDLSGMDGTKMLYVSKMFHQSAIEVNEEGSEAAAATGVVVNSRSFPRVFKANRPFLFYIKDKRSDSILFMGRYVKP